MTGTGHLDKLLEWLAKLAVWSGWKLKEHLPYNNSKPHNCFVCDFSGSILYFMIEKKKYISLYKKKTNTALFDTSSLTWKTQERLTGISSLCDLTGIIFSKMKGSFL